MPGPWTAIVLAGGRSSRLGDDKIQVDLDGQRLIDHVLAGLPAEVAVVIVGPDPGVTTRPYLLTREPEPGSGPVAAIAAGVAVTTTSLVGLLAGDMPFAGSLLPAVIDELATSPPEIDAVVPFDDEGIEQPLSAAYRTDALARALAELGNPAGRSVRDLRAQLTATVRPIDDGGRLLDVDTPDDLAAARRSVPFNRD